MKLPPGMPGAFSDLITFLSTDRYCQQVLNETVRTAKLTPIAARLQEVEGKVDQHVIPKEVSSYSRHPSGLRQSCGVWMLAPQTKSGCVCLLFVSSFNNQALKRQKDKTSDIR